MVTRSWFSYSKLVKRKEI